MENLSAVVDRLVPHLDSALIGMLVLAIGTFLVAMLDRAMRRLVEQQRHRVDISLDAAAIIVRTIRFIAFSLVIVVVLSTWGLNLTGIWTGVVGLIAGAGVALIAVWTIVSNITASLFLAIWRPYRLGDTIEILPENVKGYAIDRNLMFTVLRAEDGAQVSVPNNLIFQRIVRSRPSPPGGIDAGGSIGEIGFI